ncbi:hypothetical protein OUZ56_011724 [Daphnia magna]|uniref:Uncharacterized protein n=1 Tax=Daphnia magna TaxID=35525 RepID=A0ABQ9Z0Z3_9CRUS|nr:hypothetical protein OUZ56_011724 [Daphnia magna]
MLDIGIPGQRNRNDTGVSSQSGSSDSRSQTSRTPEERIQAIQAARVERDILVAILKEQCREIEQPVNNRGRRYIIKPLKTQIYSRLEQVRDAHFLYNQRLWEAKKPMTDAYTYITGIEIHVRGASQQSPVSTVSRATLSQADEDSFVTADEYRYNQQPQTHDPVPSHPMDRTINRYRFDTSRPVSTIGCPSPSEYDPRPLE